MDLLSAYRTFVRVAEVGSFSAVAREHGMGQATVSRQISDLEDYLGAQLLVRSTRKVALSDDGVLLLRHLRVLLGAADDAERAVGRRSEGLTGTIRLFTPVSFGRQQVVPRLADFMALHKGVEVELLSADRPIDLVENAVDVALFVGELPLSSLRARKLGDVPMILVAAPSIAATVGHDADPDALENAPSIVFLSPERVLDCWPLHNRNSNAEILLTRRAAFRTDSSEAARSALLSGLGIGLVPLWLVQRDIESGRLAIILKDWRGPALPLNVVYPDARYQSARARAFIDYLVFSLRGDRMFA